MDSGTVVVIIVFFVLLLFLLPKLIPKPIKRSAAAQHAYEIRKGELDAEREAGVIKNNRTGPVYDDPTVRRVHPLNPLYDNTYGLYRNRKRRK
ncbi:MAG: hypothetical protein AABX53_01220 [Nanoarchaeota archaeon]